MPTTKKTTPCLRCGVLIKLWGAQSKYCSTCVTVAKSCVVCQGPIAAFNKSGNCNKCRKDKWNREIKTVKRADDMEMDGFDWWRDR